MRGALRRQRCGGAERDLDAGAAPGAAYAASIEIAREKGPFPLFDRDQFLAGELIRELEEDLRDGIARHGIRNALLTSIAPTGTISLFADNISSGLEPVFSFKYSRNILMPDGSRSQEEVSDHAFRLFHKLKGEDAPLPDSFVDAQTLAPGDHLVMQAAVQKYIDSSISKTINCPADLPFEAFKDIYLQAYELGCKGCTTYRPNDVTGAVLEVRAPAERPAQSELPLAQPQPRPHDIYEAGGVVYMTQPLDRPEALPGQTYKLRWPESDHAIYITVNDIVQDGRRRPFEVFINSKNMEHYAWTVGLTRMISAVFRRGGDVSFVVEELKAVFDPRGGYWIGGKYVPSAARRHRRRDRAAYDQYRLHRRAGAPSRAAAQGREPAAGPGRRREPASADLPQMQPAFPHPPGRLRPLHLLRLFEVQLD